MNAYDPADPHPETGPPEWLEDLPIDIAAPWNLVQGDAVGTLLRLPDGIADAIIADPPYSSGGFTRGDRMGSTTSKYVLTGTQIARPDFAGDNRDQRGYLTWSTVWMDQALRITKPGGSILVFTDWRQLPVTTDAIQCGGWVWRGICPWDKGEGTRPRRGGFRSQAEYVVWGTAGHLREDHEEYLPGFIRAPIRQADKHHITGKPTDLMAQLARIAPPGGLIVDPFAGSGTTGVGALEQGRRFLGIEKTDAYATIARDRLSGINTQATLFAPPSMLISGDTEPDHLFDLES